MVRLQVQNHKAVNAVFNVDKAAALLRDITNQEYLPLTISESVRRDLRGESPATVRMALGQCFDSERMVVDAGDEIQWVNEGEAGQFLQFNATDFEAGTNPLPGQDGRVEIPVGGSFSQTFGAQGVFDYECGNADLTSPAHLLVEGTDGKSNTKGRAVVFLNGPFELPRGHGLDGWMVFEAPPDTRFRDFRWRAGDSITIRF
jgi:plastocyanin